MEKLTKNDDGKMILVNIVEEMVRMRVDALITTMEMCECKKCRLNACALALNRLPSHYVTTEKGALLGKLDNIGVNYQTKVAVEVMKALMIVKEQPMH